MDVNINDNLSSGMCLPKKTLKLTINKKTYKSKTNSKGIATFKLNLKTKKTYNYLIVK